MGRRAGGEGRVRKRVPSIAGDDVRAYTYVRIHRTVNGSLKNSHVVRISRLIVDYATRVSRCAYARARARTRVCAYCACAPAIRV